MVSCYRRVDQVLNCVGSILRCLSCDGVADTVFWIEPERWRSLETAAERNQKILCDVVG